MHTGSQGIITVRGAIVIFGWHQNMPGIIFFDKSNAYINDIARKEFIKIFFDITFLVIIVDLSRILIGKSHAVNDAKVHV